MLKVDLGRLRRERRVGVDEEVAPGDPLWGGIPLRLRGPVRLNVQAQQAAADVVVRGSVSGEVLLECRRCLAQVVVAFDEPVSALYRPGLEPREAAQQEVYPLPVGARELDLGSMVREHVLLALPEYVLCGQACRGLCPSCGANLNETACACPPAAAEDAWAPLRKLKRD